MSTDETVSRLCREGKTASEVAAEAGVSRQRVYQIAKRLNLKFDRPAFEAGWRTKPPKSRVLTGGVPVPISTSVAGTIAEYLVAADLMARGLKVFMPVMLSRGYDIVASREDGSLATFEVRSAHRNAAGRVVYARKSDCDSDYYALVITGEPVVYDPPL